MPSSAVPSHRCGLRGHVSPSSPVLSAAGRTSPELDRYEPTRTGTERHTPICPIFGFGSRRPGVRICPPRPQFRRGSRTARSSATGGVTKSLTCLRHSTWRHRSNQVPKRVTPNRVDVVEVHDAVARYPVIVYGQFQFGYDAASCVFTLQRRRHLFDQQLDRASGRVRVDRRRASKRTKCHRAASAQSDQSSAGPQSAISASADSESPRGWSFQA
jgi:hypothetical protein